MALEAKHTKKQYGCSQSVLYPVLTFCWNKYLEYQPGFEAVSTIFTVAYGNQQLTAVQDAENMPDHEVRSNIHEVIRKNLGVVTDKGLVNWKFLEGHITRAFPKAVQINMLEDAGKSHYRKATRHDWESASRILNMASLFINEHLVTLKDGGMPNSFENSFNTDKAEFDTVYAEFIEAETKVWKMREDKIIANNEIYRTTMAMMKTGQKIYRYDEAIKRMFVFSKVVKLIQMEDGTPAEPSLKIKTNGNHVNFGARLLGLLKILWGDNTSEDFTGDPNQVNFIDKVYAVVKLYSIVITGAISGIVELHISESNLTYIKIHKSMKELKELILQNNQLTTKVVDDILVTVNKFNTGGPDRVLNLIGNEPPSAKGLAAKAELESRGWVVLVS